MFEMLKSGQVRVELEGSVPEELDIINIIN